ncbi:MAG: F0F1 ATP synthase subunit B [Oscillospiraceae bacterium]|nr:F0F1 ATP synthase subunit B [Oscillospiraceae bacterium]
MQNLDVISVNIWLIIISLCNLVILFLIIKKFLYKPVKKMLAERQNQLDKKYSDAEDAKLEAENDRKAWSERIALAEDEAGEIIEKAQTQAKRMGDKLTDDAKRRADGIVRNAEEQAKLEKKKAEDSVKKEITDVSVLIAEKMIGREINENDHRNVIDEAIDEIGDGDD